MAMMGINGSVVVRGKQTREAWRARSWLHAADLVECHGEGPFVDIQDEAAMPLGFGWLDLASDRALHLLSFTRTRDPIGLLRTRLERAVARRRADMLGADAYRLCHGAGDGIPGVYIDRLGSGLLATAASAGLRPLLDLVTPIACELTGAQGVTEWPPRHTPSAPCPPHEQPALRFHTGRLVHEMDPRRSARSLDLTAVQEAQRHLRRWARGRALDLHAGFGGFGLQLADAGAAEVVAIEADDGLRAHIAEDAKRNGLHGVVQVAEASAEAFFEQRHPEEQFDCVVWHVGAMQSPPALAPTTHAAFERELLAIFRSLVDGGMLVLSTAGHPQPVADLEAMLARTAWGARRRLQLITRLRESPDFPTILGYDEGGLPDTLFLRAISVA
jgi:23S rRNA (cytosine1962-C5)-methyltransferase